MANASAHETIALPKGGGALHGLGEKFAPDLHTGTGNLTVPLTLPTGRNGFHPQLDLVYSAGNGNGPFGLGWSLGIPGISRKTSKGIPVYDEAKDVFILSGAEDLVPVDHSGTTTSFQPRTEGLFAQITRRRDAANDCWEVHSKDGLRSVYGTPASLGVDPATVADPSDRTKVFAWKLTRTEDPFGNRIEYSYERDAGHEGPHVWDQLYLSRIRYVDYEKNGTTEFLVSVDFEYASRLDQDPFSEYRPGFEIRTRKRCKRIAVHVHHGQDVEVRSYTFVYLDQRPELAALQPANRVSLLSQIVVGSTDNDASEALPPLEFTYTPFKPDRRSFFPLQGADLPARSLASPNLDLVDLFGSGLPDFVETNGSVRYWRNLGNGRFDRPRLMPDAPAGLALADPGVQFIDANGDGQIDLLVTTAAMSGYFPLGRDGRWDRRSFQRFRSAPSFDLEDREVKLVDLDGDGVTDAVRSGSRFECFFNHPTDGWTHTRWVERQALDAFPNVNFSDPRVKWADMTGDGLQDIVLVSDGNVEYWPNLGHGNWGRRIHMRNSPGRPHLPYHYNPKRILLGDVDGDGLADIVYVDDTEVTLWINQSGSRWSEPIIVQGTPPVSDIDAIRLADLLGSGISGVLWSRDASGPSSHHLFFHDFTGGLKPYLLSDIDNHIGATIKVEYAPSTRFFLLDQQRRDTRWKTSLPFPVHVVSRVETLDYFSQGKLTSEFRYHHGHWDGAEREFRGFGMVEQLDTEAFEQYDASGLHGPDTPFAKVAGEFFSPATLTKTWFHQGPIGDEHGDWAEIDRSGEYWTGDPPLLGHTEAVNQFLAGWPSSPGGRRIKRDALRALQGSVLRTELYGLDGSEREDRPYTVVENCYGLREEAQPALHQAERPRVFFPHRTGQRTTQWERGDDPMTQFAFSHDHDGFGQSRRHTHIACPRGWRGLDDRPPEPYLATRTRTVYATPVDPARYIHDRVATATRFDVRNSAGARALDLAALAETSAGLKLIDQALNYYDGPAFVGLPLGQVGEFGAVSRTQSLILTDDILQAAYAADVPPYLAPGASPAWTADYPAEFRTLLAKHAGYVVRTGGINPSGPKGLFANTSRRRYDFQSGQKARGLELEALDPLHDQSADPSAHRTLIAYDAYHLLPQEVTDAAGLTTHATYDYRTFQPKEVTDPNGNRVIYAFSPLGFLTASSVRGKSPAEGDQNRPSLLVEMNLLAFESSLAADRQPISIRTVRHAHHDTDGDVPLPERDETIVTVEYSDGFGRLLQTRAQTETVLFGDEHFGGGATVLPADQSDDGAGDVVGRDNPDFSNPDVVVSGWHVYDNKGRTVRKYEPFLAQGWRYARPGEPQFGRAVSMFYDPRGHLTRTRNPDGSEERVIHGVPGTIAAPDVTTPDDFEPSPWEAYTYDANDNAGRTHPVASASYRHHWDTPTSIVVDALGRTVAVVDRTRDAPTPAGGPLPPIENVVTRTTYDIRGNVLTTIDALGREAFRDHVYDCAGRKLRMASHDAGLRQVVLDAAGGIIERRDSTGALSLYGYDNLHRRVRVWTRDGGGEPLTCRERLAYGDAGSPGQSDPDRASARAANRLGKVWTHHDEAGLLTAERYDCKGNVLEKTRQVVSDAAILTAFAGPPAQWNVQPFRVDWAPPAATPLEATRYTSTFRYDALNRLKAMVYPEDVERQRRTLVPRYNRAGLLASVVLERTGPAGVALRETYIERIAYNAKGQRVLVAYGNGVMTRCAYHPHTSRLTRLRTEGYGRSADFTYRATGPLFQDYGYDYDLLGNMGGLHDRTPSSGLSGSDPDRLDRIFTYDALYRLRSATGRECDRPPDVPWDDAPRCTDLTRTRRYTEHYVYDAAGNLETLKHVANGGGYTRTFAMAAGSNRLSQLSIGATDTAYHYDGSGNMTMEATSRHFHWDWADRMKAFRIQTDGSEPSLHTHYLYDAGGQRVKKLTRKQGGHVETTVSIDGIFEDHRAVRNGVVEQNNHLHVMDDQRRIGLVRIGAPLGDPTPAVQIHLEDHLGSSTLVLDHSGQFINREEYTPYGETCFGSFARKRYRFAGKERDDESGLYYFGCRYYAPWLCRWLSADSLSIPSRSGFSSLYCYGWARPVVMVDPDGRDPGAAAAVSGGVVVSGEGLATGGGAMAGGGTVAGGGAAGGTLFAASASLAVLTFFMMIGFGINKAYEPYREPLQPSPVAPAAGAQRQSAPPPAPPVAGKPADALPPAPPLINVPTTQPSPTLVNVPPAPMPTAPPGKPAESLPSPALVNTPPAVKPVVVLAHTNASFMEEQRRRIAGTKGHPLSFLLDPKTKQWISRSKEHELGVQAGHRESKWWITQTGEGTERLAVEGAWENQWDNRTGETGRKAAFSKDTVTVGGVSVDLRTVERWISEGRLSPTSVVHANSGKGSTK